MTNANSVALYLAYRRYPAALTQAMLTQAQTNILAGQVLTPCFKCRFDNYDSTLVQGKINLADMVIGSGTFREKQLANSSL